MRRPRARIALQTARPSRPGRPTSRITASGGLASAASRPSGPSWATETRKPSSARTFSRRRARAGWSSTTRTIGAEPPLRPGRAGRGHGGVRWCCTAPMMLQDSPVRLRRMSSTHTRRRPEPRRRVPPPARTIPGASPSASSAEPRPHASRRRARLGARLPERRRSDECDPAAASPATSAPGPRARAAPDFFGQPATSPSRSWAIPEAGAGRRSDRPWPHVVRRAA